MEFFGSKITAVRWKTTKIQKFLETDILMDSADVRKYQFTNKAGQLTGEKVKISGKPALNRLQYFSVGVKNIGDEPITGEVWLDELRLSGVKKEKGVLSRNVVSTTTTTTTLMIEFLF